MRDAVQQRTAKIETDTSAFSSHLPPRGAWAPEAIAAGVMSAIRLWNPAPIRFCRKRIVIVL